MAVGWGDAGDGDGFAFLDGLGNGEVQVKKLFERYQGFAKLTPGSVTPPEPESRAQGQRTWASRAANQSGSLQPPPAPPL